MRLIDQSLLKTALPLENRREGKVRDIYDLVLPDNSPGVLIVATDRVSVFDVVLGNGIPKKGIMLTQISKFWFELLADVVENHLYSTDVDNLTHLSVDEKSLLERRVMICQKAKVIPIECIVRGYLTGGGYKEYLSTGGISGIPLPKNLVDGHRFINPIFTPTCITYREKKTWETSRKQISKKRRRRYGDMRGVGGKCDSPPVIC